MPEQISWNEIWKYGPGYLLAIIMFIVWLYEKKTTIREKQSFIDTLQALLNRRDTQRDEIIQALTEVKLYLRKAEGFEEYARESIESLMQPTPKRRVLDKKLAESIAKVESEMNFKKQ